MPGFLSFLLQQFIIHLIFSEVVTFHTFLLFLSRAFDGWKEKWKRKRRWPDEIIFFVVVKKCLLFKILCVGQTTILFSFCLDLLQEYLCL